LAQRLLLGLDPEKEEEEEEESNANETA